MVIKKAFEDDILKHNYAANIVIKKIEGNREYLNIEELRKLNDLPYSNENVKSTFIFSCFTGLLLGDLINLEFKDFRMKAVICIWFSTMKKPKSTINWNWAK